MGSYTATEQQIDKVVAGYNKVQFFGEKQITTQAGKKMSVVIFKYIKEDGTLADKDYSVSPTDMKGNFRTAFFNDLRVALGLEPIEAGKQFNLPDFGQVPPEWMTPVLAHFNQSEKEETFTGKDGLQRTIKPMRMSLFVKDSTVFKPLGATTTTNLASLEGQSL